MLRLLTWTCPTLWREPPHEIRQEHREFFPDHAGKGSLLSSYANQSILKEISPGISLEGMMMKLKLQYFGHLMQRVDLLEKTLMLGGMGAGGEGDDRG